LGCLYDPIVAEVGGVIKYGDIFEGVTMQEKVDAVTGKSSLVDVHSAGSSQLNPRISVKGDKAKTLKLPDSGVCPLQPARRFNHR
jgi:DNA-directed RNA polymerase subunit beta'